MLSVTVPALGPPIAERLQAIGWNTVSTAVSAGVMWKSWRSAS